MRKLKCLLFLYFCLASCSDKKVASDFPIIDVIGSIGNYKKVYCSDLFSSVELIPLETSDECLLDVPILSLSGVIMNDDIILVRYTYFGNFFLCTFDHTGKYLNRIGQKGQGPGDFQLISTIAFNKENRSIYVWNGSMNILEYGYNGKLIRSISIPKVEGEIFDEHAYTGNGLFVGHLSYTGKNKYSYCIYDRNGGIVTCFPNHIFFDRPRAGWSSFDQALELTRVNEQLYLKDYLNDTVFCLVNSTIQPAFVFDMGNYSYPQKYLESSDGQAVIEKAILTRFLLGTPKYFFYEILVPENLPTPKINPVYRQMANKYITRESLVYGIYNIDENTNILLDINKNMLEEKGIINDLNGGLPFFPRYYAGDNLLVDMWDAEKMKRMLTEEYFEKQTIKDQQAHQKLRELLKNLQEDDNPVVVIAKLK